MGPATIFALLLIGVAHASEDASCLANDGSCIKGNSADETAILEDVIVEESESLHLLQSKAAPIHKRNGPKSVDDVKQEILAGAKAVHIDEEHIEEVQKNQDIALMEDDVAQNRSLLSARSDSSTGSSYGPYTFTYPSGSTTYNFCANSAKRKRMTIFQGGTEYTKFTFDSCQHLACTFGQCASGYWYTSATPQNGKYSLCTCCGTGASNFHNGNTASHIYKSSSGNQIYKCSPGSTIR